MSDDLTGKSQTTTEDERSHAWHLGYAAFMFNRWNCYDQDSQEYADWWSGYSAAKKAQEDHGRQ